MSYEMNDTQFGDMLKKAASQYSPPAELKERMRTKLFGDSVQEEKSPQSRPSIFRRWWPRVASAAAVLLVGVFGYLMFISQDNVCAAVTWADVVKQIRKGQTMVCLARFRRPGSSDALIFNSRAYWKYPNSYRCEIYDYDLKNKPASLPTLLPDVLLYSPLGDADIKDATIQGNIMIVDLQIGEPFSFAPQNVDILRVLTGIQERQAIKKGEEIIDGVSTTRFEAVLSKRNKADLYLPQDTKGKITIWTDNNTNLPFRIYISGTYINYYKKEQAISKWWDHIEWNVNLPDTLFMLPEYGEYQVREVWDVICPSELVDGNFSLEVSLSDGSVILTDKDGGAVKPIIAEGTRLTSYFRTNEAANEKLKASTVKNKGKKVIIKISGKVSYVQEIRGTICGLTIYGVVPEAETSGKPCNKKVD